MKQLAYFLGWVWGWSWVAVGAGLLTWFLVGNGIGWLAFLAGLGLIVASGLIATISATVKGQFQEAKKRCPFCHERILAEAIRCKHCGADVGQYEKLKQLEARLKAPSEKEPSKVIEELTGLGNIAVPLLIETLEDSSNWIAQIEAAFALAKVRDPRAFWPLVNALKNENRNVVEMVGEALGDFGDRRAVPHLVAALRDDPSAAGVVNGLIKLNDPSAVPGLVAFLVKAQSSMGKALAAHALQKFSRQAVPALEEAYLRGNPNTRTTIIYTLRKLGPVAIPTLIGFLTSDDREIRGLAGLWLADMGEPARQSLTQAVQTADEDVKERMRLVLEDIGRNETIAADSTGSAS